MGLRYPDESLGGILPNRPTPVLLLGPPTFAYRRSRDGKIILVAVERHPMHAPMRAGFSERCQLRVMRYGMKGDLKWNNS